MIDLFRYKNDESLSRKKYMRDKYSTYWINARERIYGVMNYDLNLIKKIKTLKDSGIVLEVAAGTGVPFANILQLDGYHVHGIDISPLLVEKCLKSNPEIMAIVGDAENLPYSSNFFDITFCFHSTWYFPNLKSALEEMVRVTKINGFILFDIENVLNSVINIRYMEQLKNKKKLTTYIFQIIRKIYKLFFRINDSWQYLVFETPSDPIQLISYFRSFSNLVNIEVYGREKSDELTEIKCENDFQLYERIIFLLKKQGPIKSILR